MSNSTRYNHHPPLPYNQHPSLPYKPTNPEPTKAKPKAYSLVSVEYIDPDTPDDEFMVSAGLGVTRYLTEQVRDTGWLTLRNDSDSRSINASLVKAFTLREVQKD